MVILALIAIAALIFLPALVRFSEDEGDYSCQSNLKQISLGFAAYVQDWHEKYPVVNVKDAAIDEKNPLGWADALQPYLKFQRVF